MRAVIDMVAIIFFVLLGTSFDLAGQGEGAIFATELFERLTTGVVETTRQIGFQPDVERRIRSDCELSNERMWVQLGQRGRAPFTYPVVDQAAAQMGAVYPFGNAGVMIVRNQQRETIIVQKPLSGSLPGPFFFAYLDQFARERQIGLIKPKCLAQVVANRENVCWNVGPTPSSDSIS